MDMMLEMMIMIIFKRDLPNVNLSTTRIAEYKQFPIES